MNPTGQRITSNPVLLDIRFLSYYVKTAAFRDQVTAQGSTNYAAIRPSHVLAYTMPLPPLEEQRRIATCLDSVLEKVETLRSLQSEVRLAFQHFLPSVLNSAFTGQSTDSSISVADYLKGAVV